jgi:hypothetical protein
MTVFLTHAGADREAADSLAKVFERRGLFVEDEDGGHGFRPLMARDVVVLLWSNAALMSPHRLLMERRALEAWAEGRLVLVRLDHGFPPVGLRDLPAIDATFEAQRAFTWEEVVRAVQAALSAPPDDMPAAPAPMSIPVPTRRAEPAPVAAAKKGAGAAGGFAWLSIIVAALAAVLFAALHFKLVPDLGVKPLHPDALPGPVFWIGVAAALLALLFSLNAMARKAPPTAAKRAPAPQAEAEAPAAAPAPAPIFISYAHADTDAVAPLAAAVAEEVRPVWIDKQGIAAGDTWAGEIVRGIKTAAGVVVMCSAAAYQSDHVKREIYLADRYKKRLLPVLLDAAPAPEDFEYFFAGVQYLDTAGLSAQARADAIVRLAANL